MPDYHARKSPSGMKSRMLCPGKDNMEATIKTKEVPSRHAALGTVAHGVGEDCLNKNKSPEDFYLEERTADGFTFKVDDDMIRAVNVYVDYIRETIDEFEMEGFTVKLFVEVWGSLEHWNIPGMEGGTSDCVLVVMDGDYVHEIIVIDYKHGQGVIVPAKENPQALCYAEGVAQKFIDDGFKVTKNTHITLSIVQPRAREEPEPIKEWSTTYGWVKKWFKKTLIPAVELSMEPDAPLIPGDEQCRWCRYKTAPCPALYDKTQELAVVDFEDIVEMPDPKSLSKQQKTFLVQHAKMITQFIKDVEESINHEMQAGEDYEEFKLVRAKTNRGLVEDAKDPDFSPLLDYLELSEVFVLKPRGIGEIERALKDKYGLEKMKEIMAENTHKRDGEIVIAPLNDPRLEYHSEIDDFKNVKK